ncbi:hypothetical protein [Streptacidiphilus sp. EB103A]|uniref:hypothetical protein n=1 Tax=Streptacidiphilus sp. EB103A TaxID=3156275 RepID=UPI003512E968
MSRRSRNRRTGRAPSGGVLPWMLSLPARMHLRWLVILVVLLAAMGAYARVLVTATPMPPSKAPAVRTGSPVPASATPSSRVG